MAGLAVPEGHDRGLGITAEDFIGKFVGAAIGRPAEPDLAAVEHAVDALPRLFLDPGQWRFRGRRARDGGCDRMAAG